MAATEDTPLLLQVVPDERSLAGRHREVVERNNRPTHGCWLLRSLSLMRAAAVVASLLLFLFFLSMMESSPILRLQKQQQQHIFLGIGVPQYNPLSQIETLKYWETRIFFSLRDENGDTTARSKLLTLDNPSVSQAMFPEYAVPHWFDDNFLNAEERVDDYVLLEDCCLNYDAGQIGLKARGGNITRLELKTAHDRQTHQTDGGSSLTLWIKSTKTFRLKENTRASSPITVDPWIWEEFLTDCNSTGTTSNEDADHRMAAQEVFRWMASKTNQQEPLKVVRTWKRRRSVLVENETISVQQADIKFQLFIPEKEDNNNNNNDGNDGHDAWVLRSWSAEAVDDTAELHRIAASWQERFAKAVSTSGLVVHAPAMWVASYPEMILRVPRQRLE